MPRFRFLPVAATLIVWGCGSSPVAQGGSGSDAGNVLTVLARAHDGSVQPGATVEVWPSNQVPDSLGTAASYQSTTDSAGRASLRLPAGPWSVLVRKDGLGCWKIGSQRDSLIDTLVPLAKLSGQLRGAEGKRVALQGLGVSANCDSSGRFSFTRLPAGLLTLVAVVPQGSEKTEVPLSPGSSVTFSAEVDSLPAVVDTATVVSSALRAALQDTGAWAFDVSLSRTDSVQPGRIFSWSNGSDTAGIEVWWSGRDSLHMRLDGVVYSVQQVPTDTITWNVGIAYSAGQVQLYLQGTVVGSGPCRSAADRSTWTEPVVAGSGIKTVLQYGSARGVPDSTFFGGGTRPETTTLAIPASRSALSKFG